MIIRTSLKSQALMANQHSQAAQDKGGKFSQALFLCAMISRQGVDEQTALNFYKHILCELHQTDFQT